MKLEFVRAKKEDADALIDIYNSAFLDDFVRYGHCQAYGRSRAEMEQSVKKFPKIIASLDGVAVGVISYCDEGCGKYYIGCLGVKKEFQGQGIGTQLMKYWMSTIEDWKEISLVTPEDRPENLKFYRERFGFVVTGKEQDVNLVMLKFRLCR